MAFSLINTSVPSIHSEEMETPPPGTVAFRFVNATSRAMLASYVPTTTPQAAAKYPVLFQDTLVPGDGVLNSMGILPYSQAVGFMWPNMDQSTGLGHRFSKVLLTVLEGSGEQLQGSLGTYQNSVGLQASQFYRWKPRPQAPPAPLAHNQPDGCTQTPVAPPAPPVVPEGRFVSQLLQWDDTRGAFKPTSTTFSSQGLSLVVEDDPLASEPNRFLVTLTEAPVSEPSTTHFGVLLCLGLLCALLAAVLVWGWLWKRRWYKHPDFPTAKPQAAVSREAAVETAATASVDRLFQPRVYGQWAAAQDPWFG